MRRSATIQGRDLNREEYDGSRGSLHKEVEQKDITNPELMQRVDEEEFTSQKMWTNGAVNVKARVRYNNDTTKESVDQATLLRNKMI